MEVYNYLMNRLKKHKLHLTLLDPDKQIPQMAGTIANTVEKLGTDAIMVGGSTGVTSENLSATVRGIKANSQLPVILFPTNEKALAKEVDAIYFMSVMNSRNIDNLVRRQLKAAPVISAMGIEPIPMGYVIVEPGMTVGSVGEADLVPRNDPEKALAYALTCQFFGMKLFYLEAGSGAPDPVPIEMIRKVRTKLSIPLIVGGGIRTAEQAKEVAEAGADIVVTGTIVEESAAKRDLMKGIISAVHHR